ncbi:unnamed protein product, partial [Amoebophrya sp. A25]|eukprot:GSA25T00004340001.1
MKRNTPGAASSSSGSAKAQPKKATRGGYDLKAVLAAKKADMNKGRPDKSLLKGKLAAAPPVFTKQEKPAEEAEKEEQRLLDRRVEKEQEKSSKERASLQDKYENYFSTRVGEVTGEMMREVEERERRMEEEQKQDEQKELEDNNATGSATTVVTSTILTDGPATSSTKTAGNAANNSLPSTSGTTAVAAVAEEGGSSSSSAADASGGTSTVLVPFNSVLAAADDQNVLALFSASRRTELAKKTAAVVHSYRAADVHDSRPEFTGTFSKLFGLGGAHYDRFTKEEVFAALRRLGE